MKCPDCGHDNIAGEDTCESCSAPLSSLEHPEARGKKGVQKKLIEGIISQIGVKDAELIPLTTTVADAIRMMRQYKTGCVLVGEKGQALWHLYGTRHPAGGRRAPRSRKNPAFLRHEGGATNPPGRRRGRLCLPQYGASGVPPHPDPAERWELRHHFRARPAALSLSIGRKDQQRNG